MVLRANPSRLLVSQVAAGIAKECAEPAKTFRAGHIAIYNVIHYNSHSQAMGAGAR